MPLINVTFNTFQIEVYGMNNLSDALNSFFTADGYLEN
jgi:hypothetical protein